MGLGSGGRELRWENFPLFFSFFILFFPFPFPFSLFLFSIFPIFFLDRPRRRIVVLRTVNISPKPNFYIVQVSRVMRELI